MERVQKKIILKDLEKKLVLLVGPRQCGKTWLSKNIAKNFPNSVYLNYDQELDKKMIEEQSWLDSTDLLILDELHKMKGWKNYLKGVYDTKPDSMRLLVTGSARLDVYDKLGDSLAGRYFRHRLLPISLAELEQVSAPMDINKLLAQGGFPEPYLAENETEANRWRMHYINSLLSTDIFEIDKIYNAKAMQLVFSLLRNRVGSPCSYQSLAEDVAVSPTTIKKYIQILEALFIVFTIQPYSKNIARSLLKEPKIYFFDTGLVQGDEGAKFENLVAVSLLKHVYGKVDIKAEDYGLYYLRTKDSQEVDFALVAQNNIEVMIEAKLSDRTPSKSLIKFHEKYNYPAIQLVKSLRNDYEKEGIKILKAEKFLASLFL
ncbi:MAG: ATP-binding protein [Alphaproteobacteria bacterium]|nr:ATP-binding protein [Alphaproteobacteria bacterium]